MLKYASLAFLMMAAMAAAPVVRAEPGPIAAPSTLAVPAGNVLLFKTYATGAQIYVCTAPADNPGAFMWTFKAPEAVLRNEAGEQVGRHFAGPSWQGNDGSTVVGEAVTRADAADPGAIPWLLLKATSHEGAGVFSSITYIQRLETVGGVAPADGCDRSVAGATRSAPYTATYAFYYGAAQ
jgi:hypothetical protein